MSNVVVDLGDYWGPCDVKWLYVKGDESWGEEGYFEYDVYYRGDEDGSRNGEEISIHLTDADHKKIIREIEDSLDGEC